MVKKKRVTIKDVAVEAGVSIGTVSRYIRNSGYVSETSKVKISKAIADLSYIPNASARNMISRKSKIVGIAVPEINNPFLANLVIRLEEGLSQKGYSVMLCNTGFNMDKASAFIDDLIMRDAEGIILAAMDIICSDIELVNKINYYMCGISVGQKIINFDSINYAERKMAYEMTEYLIRMGHTEIACIAFNKYAFQTIERKAGYMQAIMDYNLPLREEYMVGFDGTLDYVVGENGGYICAKKVLENERHPTAIIAINDFYATGAYQAAKEKGLVIGKDISIVGFDNIELSGLVAPPLTTVDCDVGKMAEHAVRLLDERIRGERDKTAVQEIILPSEPVYRDSVNRIV